jgi:hypothetical protein
VWILLGVVSLVIFGSTFFVQLRIVVLQPDLGDVSAVVGGVSQLLLIVATLFSGLMAYLSDSSESGPATKVEVEGDYYDISFSSDESPDTSEMRDALSERPEGGEDTETEQEGDHGRAEATSSDEDAQS